MNIILPSDCPPTSINCSRAGAHHQRSLFDFIPNAPRTRKPWPNEGRPLFSTWPSLPSSLSPSTSKPEVKVRCTRLYTRTTNVSILHVNLHIIHWWPVRQQARWDRPPAARAPIRRSSCCWSPSRSDYCWRRRLAR